MILIRADANSEIGTGHVMRCKAIASQLRERGEKVIFITADRRGDGLLDDYQTICMNTEWTDMLSELNWLHGFVSETKPRAILVDSYFVKMEYFKQLSEVVKTIYMDDLNEECWDISILINYNIFASVFDYSRYDTTQTKLLLDPAYAPLREEFRFMPARKIKYVVTNVMVSTGGADPEGITEKIMREICPIMKEVYFHFVVGVLNPRLKAIKEIARDTPNIVLHVNEKNMSKLMCTCDIAISAAGTTLYELCAAGLPTITFCLADNQLNAASQFQNRGIMFNAGDCRNNPKFIKQLENRLIKLASDFNARLMMARRMQNMVDGEGAGRIAEYILNYLA